MTNDVQYYDHVLKELKHPWKNKIEKFIRNGCIEELSPGKWVCKPIKGYNTRTYSIEILAGEYFCNCQGYKKRGNCSHVCAVQVVRSAENKNPEQGQLF